MNLNVTRYLEGYIYFKFYHIQFLYIYYDYLYMFIFTSNVFPNNNYALKCTYFFNIKT
jgi:hypothetical protein